MQAQRINITLPYKLAQDFKRTVPVKKRSGFIAAALEEKITKKRNLKTDLIKSLRANREFYRKIHEDFKYVDAEAFEKIP